MALTLRTLGEDDHAPFSDLVAAAFLHDAAPGDAEPAAGQAHRP